MPAGDTSQEPISYFKKTWMDEVVEWTNADEKMQQIGQKLNEKHAYIVLDCPDSTDRLGWFQFDRGRIVGHGYEEHESPADFSTMTVLEGADFITTATYDFMTKVNKGDVNAMQAMMSAELNIQGSKRKMMRQVKQLQYWQDLFTQIPVEYGV